MSRIYYTVPIGTNVWGQHLAVRNITITADYSVHFRTKGWGQYFEERDI